MKFDEILDEAKVIYNGKLVDSSELDALKNKDGEVNINGVEYSKAKERLQKLLKHAQKKLDNMDDAGAISDKEEAAIMKRIALYKKALSHLNSFSKETLSSLADAKKASEVADLIGSYDKKIEKADATKAKKDSKKQDKEIEKNGGDINVDTEFADEPTTEKEKNQNSEYEKEAFEIISKEVDKAYAISSKFPSNYVKSKITKEDIQKQYETQFLRSIEKLLSLKKRFGTYLEEFNELTNGKKIKKSEFDAFKKKVLFFKSKQYAIPGTKDLRDWYLKTATEINSAKVPSELRTALRNAQENTPTVPVTPENILDFVVKANDIDNHIEEREARVKKGHAKKAQGRVNVVKALVDFLDFTSRKDEKTTQANFDRKKGVLIQALNAMSVKKDSEDAQKAGPIKNYVENLKFSDLDYEEMEPVKAFGNMHPADRYNADVFNKLYPSVDDLKSYNWSIERKPDTIKAKGFPVKVSGLGQEKADANDEAEDGEEGSSFDKGIQKVLKGSTRELPTDAAKKEYLKDLLSTISKLNAALEKDVEVADDTSKLSKVGSPVVPIATKQKIAAALEKKDLNSVRQIIKTDIQKNSYKGGFVGINKSEAKYMTDPETGNRIYLDKDSEQFADKKSAAELAKEKENKIQAMRAAKANANAIYHANKDYKYTSAALKNAGLRNTGLNKTALIGVLNLVKNNSSITNKKIKNLGEMFGTEAGFSLLVPQEFESVGPLKQYFAMAPKDNIDGYRLFIFPSTVTGALALYGKDIVENFTRTGAKTEEATKLRKDVKAYVDGKMATAGEKKVTAPENTTIKIVKPTAAPKKEEASIETKYFNY